MCGAAGGALFSKAVTEGSTTVATAVSGLYPALACVLCAVFLGEAVKPNHVVGVILAIGSGLAFAYQ